MIFDLIAAVGGCIAIAIIVKRIVFLLKEWRKIK